jgi:hypothetical protein
VRTNSFVDEEVILNLEREAFIDFLKQEKTLGQDRTHAENRQAPEKLKTEDPQ